METNFSLRTVAEIVRNDYRATDVFKKYGIAYCCGGQVALEEACLLKQLNSFDVIQDLEQACRTVKLSNNLQYDQWRLDFLVDYLINVHHAYLQFTLPALGASLSSFVHSHRKQHAELEKILELFDKMSPLLTTHNIHEEEIIFPYIKQIENAYLRRETYGNLFVRTLRKPLSDIQNERMKTRELLNEMRSFTNNYQFPSNACTNHQVLFNRLLELDNDLVQHSYLENNILFPKAILMEKGLLQF